VKITLLAPAGRVAARGSRVRRAGPLVSAVAVAVLAAACSSGHPNASPAPPGGGGQGNGLAFTACMRSHGVKDFPDPNSQGQVILTPAESANLNPGSATFQSAMNACKSLAPGAPSKAQQASNLAGALKFAACMRSHGIVKFPDPNNQGGFAINDTTAGLNPNSPLYQSAQRACQHYIPAGPGSGGGFHQTFGPGGGGS
jgi:hypothetical protein